MIRSEAKNRETIVSIAVGKETNGFAVITTINNRGVPKTPPLIQPNTMAHPKERR